MAAYIIVSLSALRLSGRARRSVSTPSASSMSRPSTDSYADSSGASSALLNASLIAVRERLEVGAGRVGEADRPVVA